MVRFVKERFYKDQFIYLPVCNCDEVFDIDTWSLHDSHLSKSDDFKVLCWILTSSIDRVLAVID